MVLDCDPNALAHTLRVVCNTTDTSNSGCAHLYQNVDPVGKIVRLPENVRSMIAVPSQTRINPNIIQCGKSPFARIASVTTSDNQTIDDHVMQNIAGRDEQTPVVTSITVDTNFTAVDVSR